MMVPILATVIRALWIIAEYMNLRRFKVEPGKDWDRSSAKLWDAANAIEPIGMILGFSGFGQIQIGRGVISAFGLGLLLAGIGIRWTAIHHLGKYFTGKVVIKDGHQLVRNGPYRHLRHPGYTGALLAHLGLGLS